MLNPADRISEIVRRWPETMSVFARYNLDLCCGGAHSLEYAAERHHLNIEKLRVELDEAIQSRKKEPSSCSTNQDGRSQKR